MFDIVEYSVKSIEFDKSNKIYCDDMLLSDTDIEIKKIGIFSITSHITQVFKQTKTYTGGSEISTSGYQEIPSRGFLGIFPTIARCNNSSSGKLKNFIYTTTNEDIKNYQHNYKEFAIKNLHELRNIINQIEEIHNFHSWIISNLTFIHNNNCYILKAI